jgi:hypothetical protein
MNKGLIKRGRTIDRGARAGFYVQTLIRTYFPTLKMEERCLPEKSVGFHRTTQRYMAEGTTL